MPAPRAVLAEFLGTCALLVAVVGSGIMAQQLTKDVGVALLANAAATGLALYVLIAALLPVSGAHFNPLVTAVAALRREIDGSTALTFVLAQFSGALLGVVVAHLMFDQPLLQAGVQARNGLGMWIGEIVATAGLLLAITMLRSAGGMHLASGISAYIAAAYWFTSSTSFANPAVTVARALTATFAGIRPIDVPGFVVAQSLGAVLALVIIGPVFAARRRPEEQRPAN